MNKELSKIVKSVFKRRVRKKESGVYVKIKVGKTNHLVIVYPSILKSDDFGGLHICRIDTKDESDVYYVEPRNLKKWLQSVKVRLDSKHNLFKKMKKAKTDEERSSIVLDMFMNNEAIKYY